MHDDKIDFNALLTRFNGGKSYGAAAKLAVMINVSEPTVGRWKKGEIPSDAHLPLVAKAMGVSQEKIKRSVEIIRRKVQPFPEEMRNMKFGEGEIVPLPIEHVPVLGTISAGNFDCGFETAIPEEFIPIVFTGIPGKKFALKVSGDCMEPTARDGDYAYVVRVSSVPNGKLAALRIGGECTLKRVFKFDDRIELRPDNPAFKTLTVKAEDVVVLGQVIWFGRKP